MDKFIATVWRWCCTGTQIFNLTYIFSFVKSYACNNHPSQPFWHCFVVYTHSILIEGIKTRQKFKYNIAITHTQIFASWTFPDSHTTWSTGVTHFLIALNWAHITEYYNYQYSPFNFFAELITYMSALIWLDISGRHNIKYSPYWNICNYWLKTILHWNFQVHS